jgi:hypothetical protein
VIVDEGESRTDVIERLWTSLPVLALRRWRTLYDRLSAAVEGVASHRAQLDRPGQAVWLTGN